MSPSSVTRETPEIAGAARPTKIFGPAMFASVTTMGSVRPVEPYPRRAARFAAAAFSAAVASAGPTIWPARESAMPSPLVSWSSHPRAKASARCEDGGGAESCRAKRAIASARAGAVYNTFMKFTLLTLLTALGLAAADVNTFSIVAYDPTTGDCGVTVASKYFSVGAVVPWGEARSEEHTSELQSHSFI